MIVNVCMQKTNAHIRYSAELSFNVFHIMISKKFNEIIEISWSCESS